MNAAWLERLRARADQPPLRPRVPLRLASAVIGSVEPGLGDQLAAAGLPVAATGDAVVLQGEADASLARIARWLHEHGLASRWRDELLAVTDDTGRVQAAVERAAVRPLGITTFAVHLVGRDPAGRWWLQQRALDKATDPGRWDTLMGGLVADRESLQQTLERETWEEAGLRLADLEELREHGALTVRRPVAEGYMVERMAVYSARVPAHLVPENQDGEVERFECVDEPTLRARLAADAFTLEAALVLLRVMGE
ncbi:NUDIX hydrolase [Piscinibacter defluvii]|uniref:NUDIX hydrolase n=1 Tax=Piscinibacter defluvii TaxID=1796922 RepID=UPI000FDE49B3|nr:NUDIX domain-containing protein [Piscinibacter defluvii]